MRIVTYRSDRGARAGVLRDGRRGRRLGRARRPTARAFAICSNPAAWPRSAEIARRASDAARARSSCCRRSPTRRRSSASGSTTAPTPPRPASSRPRRRPSSPSSATRWRAPGATVPLPAASEKVDYEAEVAFVIGRRAQGRRARPRRSTTSPATRCSTTSRRATSSSRRRSGCRARSSTARRPAGRRWSRPTRRGPHDAISFSLTLNGEQMQSASTDDLIFSVPELVAHLSRADDARARRHRLDRHAVRGRQRPASPRVWLKPGDEIAISSPTLGRLETRIG